MDCSKVVEGSYFENELGDLYLITGIIEIRSETYIKLYATPVYSPSGSWEDDLLYMARVTFITNESDILNKLEKATEGKINKLRMLGLIE